MSKMKRFATERDEAFTEFVTTGKKEKLLAYCKKYHVPVPTSEKALAGGIYKAVQGCTNIPEDVKLLAALKCTSLGMNPYSMGEVRQKEEK